MYIITYYRRLIWVIILDVVARRGSYDKVMGR